MVRVPNIISSTFLGGDLDATEELAPALHRMSDAEVARYIKRSEAALRGYQMAFDRHREEDAIAAFETTMAMLLEVADVYPSHRSEIERIVAFYGYPAVAKDQ